MMITKYVVNSEYASAIFYDHDAAVSAFMLLVDYHPDIEVQRRDVEHMLGLYGKYTADPLEIESFGDPDEGDGRGLVNG